MPKKKNSKAIKSVETITHDEASRKNIPTGEFRVNIRYQVESAQNALTY